jgi:hypothetical protein
MVLVVVRGWRTEVRDVGDLDDDGGSVAALASKAADRATEATIQGGEGVLRRRAGRMGERFSDAGDDRAVGTLALVERGPPDSAQLVRDLAEAVDRQVGAMQCSPASLRSLSIGRARRASVSIS